MLLHQQAVVQTGGIPNARIASALPKPLLPIGDRRLWGVLGLPLAAATVYRVSGRHQKGLQKAPEGTAKCWSVPARHQGKQLLAGLQ